MIFQPIIPILPRTVAFKPPILHWISLSLTNTKSISDLNWRPGLLSSLLAATKHFDRADVWKRIFST